MGMEGYSLLHLSDFISLLPGIWRKIKQNKTEQRTTPALTTTDRAPATMTTHPNPHQTELKLTFLPLRLIPSGILTQRKEKKLVQYFLLLSNL